MTFARSISVLICALWGVSALGQPIPVSSGEHGNFSRLVFEGRNVQGWNYDQSDENHSLTFPDHQDGFETASIYRYIRNDRLKSFESRNSKFQFQIGCDCEIDIFEIGKTVLVVDIKIRTKDIEIDDAKFFELALLPTQPTPFRFGASGPKEEEKDGIDSASILYVPNAADSSTANVSNLSEPAFGSLSIDLPKEQQTLELKKMQAQLLEEIGSASSRGVLEPNASFAPLATENFDRRPQLDPRIFDSSHVLVPAKRNEGAQIRITSSADNNDSERAQGQVTPRGHACIDSSLIDVSAWSDGRSFEEQLGERRRELFGEFDTLDQEKAIKLVRLYIHFGFGAEAKNILMLNDGGRQEWPELWEMAQILEYGFVKNGRTLREFQNCNSAGALWGILASKEIAADQSIDARAALREIGSLPSHLRTFLSPELSKRLLNYGDRTGAKSAMRNLDRLGTPVDESATLAHAEIEASKGELETAGTLLQEVVNSNSEFSARALIGLIETEIKTGRTIDIATANLVEAYAMELRDAPIGEELQRIHVLALAKSGQFGKAFSALDRLELHKELGSLRSKMLQLLVSDADDSTFLELIFDRMPKLILVKDKEHIFQSAVRLQALGFSETAEKLLSDGEVGTSSRSQKMLLAQISLDLGRPALADAFLLDLEGADAAILRAKSKEQKLDRASAYELYAQIGAPQEAQNNAWLSDDWQTLTDPSTAFFGSLVPVANRNLNQPEGSDGMMARSQSLLDESLETRELIGLILQNGNN